VSEPGRARILIVEDEPEFASLLELWVSHHGWDASVALDGDEGWRSFSNDRFDLVLLDLNVPGRDGWQLIEDIRRVSQVPVLMVTALGEEADKIRGLEAGADDYVTKPLSLPELVARIQAALRRARVGGAAPGDGFLQFEGLTIDPANHRVRVAAIDVHLTPTEFRLLHYLAQRPEALISHRELLQAVWGPSYGDDTQLLRVTMRNLRAKLGSAAPERHFIATEYGLGYRFGPA